MLLPRSLRRRSYGGIIKHFLLRSDELCEGQGGHYKELTVGKFDVVSTSFVCTNPRNSVKRSRGLFPLTQNKHNAVLSSQSSKSESAARCSFFSFIFSLQPIAFEPHRCPPPPTPALSGCGGRPVSLRPRSGVPPRQLRLLLLPPSKSVLRAVRRSNYPSTTIESAGFEYL